jgi:hypothetical protein
VAAAVAVLVAVVLTGVVIPLLPADRYAVVAVIVPVVAVRDCAIAVCKGNCYKHHFTV